MELDTILPDYHFNEKNKILINSSPEVVYNTLLNDERLMDSIIIKLMLWLRELPMALSGENEKLFSDTAMTLKKLMKDAEFTLLTENENKEIIFGFIGQFWNLFKPEKVSIPDLNTFLEFHTEAYGKAAINFYFEPHGTATKLITETRIYLPDKASLRKFRFYWTIIYPFSYLMRQIILNNIKLSAEN